MKNALFDAPRRGRNPEITDEEKAWIINIACQRPADYGYAAETWTYAKLTSHINKTAEAAGYVRLSTIHKSTVYTILSEADIKPHKITYYCENRDPDFDSKMHNVLLVYKQLQMQFDESTVSLLAAIDLQTGEAIPLVRDKHSSKEYIEFLKFLDEKYPKGDKIRLALDNLKVHTSNETRRYLATIPERFEFVFTPKHGSWLNMVEGFFDKMTRQMLRGIRVKTKDELVSRIHQYFSEINEEPVVFHWRYNLDVIDVSEEIIVDTLPVKMSS